MQKIKVDLNQSPSASRIEDLKKVQKQQNRKQKIKKFLKTLVLLFVIAGIATVGYLAYTRWDRLQRFNSSIISNSPDAKVCDNIFDPKCWGEALKPQLEQNNKITGILIVGLDTREKGGVNQGNMNTDSIIAAFYNHDTKKTMLISLPRDLYVPYKIGSNTYHERINAIYATGEQRSDVDDGFDLLEQTVEDIFGQEIQYRVVIRLKGVEEAVDAVGGVNIDVPTYLKIQYPNDYPGKDGNPNTTWLYYEFQPGEQKMDGEHALVWARFRMVIHGDQTFGSDFSRAERQQQVLDSLKEQALNSEGSTLDKAEKYWDIFQAINDSVDTNIGLEEIFAGLSLANEADTDPVNIVLDPYFGGMNQIIYHPPTDQTGGAYYIKFKDETFKQLQSYLTLIEKYPKIYDEDVEKILIENRVGRIYVSTDTAIKFRDAVNDGDLMITPAQMTMITSSKGDDTGVIIVDFTKGEKYGTTKYLAEYFGAKQIIENPENYGFEQTGYKEEIRVIVYPEAATE